MSNREVSGKSQGDKNSQTWAWVRAFTILPVIVQQYWHKQLISFYWIKIPCINFNSANLESGVGHFLSAEWHFKREVRIQGCRQQGATDRLGEWEQPLLTVTERHRSLMWNISHIRSPWLSPSQWACRQTQPTFNWAVEAEPKPGTWQWSRRTSISTFWQRTCRIISNIKSKLVCSVRESDCLWCWALAQRTPATIWFR